MEYNQQDEISATSSFLKANIARKILLNNL